MKDKFTAEMKDRLEQMKEEVRETLEMEREDFDTLLADTQIFDLPEQASNMRHTTRLANLGLQERERLRRVLSALHKIETGEGYGVCETCGSSISEERLRAKPEAHECINCRRRHEEEGR